MPRVHFTADHDYRNPKFPQTVAYKKGWKGLVSTHLADEAVGLGKAELIGSSVRRGSEPGSEAEAQAVESDDDGAGGSGRAAPDGPLRAEDQGA